jgi:hypothetical protein
MLSLVLCLTVLNTAAIGYFVFSQVKKLSRITAPNAQLAEIVTDFQVHGYSVLRVAPDTVLVRSPR